MKKFKALSSGTLGNPYRLIEKDQIVPLNDDEAKVYANCKWLVPLADAQKIKQKPIMSHMADESNLHPHPILLSSGQLGDDAYNRQMESIKKRENTEDGIEIPVDTQPDEGSEEETIDGDVADGTGEQDVI